jgi:hypothetical protein
MIKKIFLLSILFASAILGQKNLTAIDVKVGYNSSVFNFDDLYEGGVALNVGVLYPFYENLQFSLNTGYGKWSFDNRAFNLKNTNEFYSNFNIDAPLTIIPITLGIKYYATNSKVKPYFSAEFGFFYYSQEASGTYTYTPKQGANSETYSLPELSDSGFRTMLNAGAGIVAPISNNLDLDFQVKMNALFNAQAVGGSNNSGEVEGTSSTMYFLTIAVGVNYYYETK